MDSDRLLFVFVCFISLLFCVTPARLVALRPKYLEPAALKDGGELKQPCRINNDCGNFGYICSPNKTCQCAKLYRPNYETKQCLAGIDQKCKYDEHCIEGAYCMNQSNCKCKEHWPYISEDGMECSSGTSKYLNLQNILIGCILFVFIT